MERTQIPALSFSYGELYLLSSAVRADAETNFLLINVLSDITKTTELLPFFAAVGKAVSFGDGSI